MSAMGPLMNIESQNDWMLFRLTPLAQWCVSLALLSATASPAPSFSQGTPEQRLACTPDVLRLCSAFIPNADEITVCLKERSPELSDACRTVFEAEITQLPSASESTQARKRTTKWREKCEMSVHNMRFVLVTDMVPRVTSVCTACSRPLKQGYLHDLATSRRYCGIECYPQWTVMRGFIWSFASANPFELAIAWPMTSRRRCSPVRGVIKSADA
jgi:hypothetical protein